MPFVHLLRLFMALLDHCHQKQIWSHHELFSFIIKWDTKLSRYSLYFKVHVLKIHSIEFAPF